MKPRNDFERELQAVIDNGKLHPITPKQIEQAHKIISQQRQHRQFVMTTKQTIKAMKLTKCYKVHRIGKGQQMLFFCLCIVKAERDGKTAWAARDCNMGAIDSFSHNGPLTIKSERFFYEDYVRGGWPLYSTGKANPYAVVRHYNLNDYEFRDSRIETLAKDEGWPLIEQIMLRERPLTDHLWAAYKVAKRHGYNFQGELWRWMDMVDLLHLNKKDRHNPVFICPDNLAEAYSRIIDINDRRLRRLAIHREMRAGQRAMEESEKQRKEAEAYNDTYIEQHKKWLGVVIIGRGITIKPLQSIAEFREEAETMHHCVYANAYYKKKDSLIMSARDKNGKRLATIEYDLKQKSILQCRAAYNAQPERYKEICNLITKHDFRKAKKLQPCKQ